MTRWRTAVVCVAVVAVVAAVTVVPLPVALGANRLLPYGLAAAGAWLVVGRVGVVDLASGASVGAGAYLGGVVSGLTGLPPVLGLLTGALAGAAVSGVNAAVAGRVGRTSGALTSLALGAAVVAGLRSWSTAGGVAGFHAVPLLTPDDRLDLAAALVLVALGLAVVAAAARHRRAAAAAVAAHAPAVAASLGRRPVVDTAVAGVVAGAVLGLAGALQAFLVGSVVPDGYGLGLSAALALAAVLGGRAPWGPLVGALLLWGPGVVLPLVPVVGDGPVLLATGIAGLALLGLRRGRPIVVTATGASGREGERPEPHPPVVARQARLEVRGAELPGGRVDLEVRPGEVVALAGPNGTGKSTLLARVAGQLPDAGNVRLDGREPPAGARARAHAGVGRTWQRPPELDLSDAAAVTADGPAALGAAAWAEEVLGAAAATPAGAQLVRLAARRPAVALLDEPAADVPVAALARFVRGLAAGGAAVLVVEHRREALGVADRVVTLGGRT